MSNAHAFEVDPHAPDAAHQTDSWHKHGAQDAPVQSAHGEISGPALLAWLLALFVGVFGAIIVLIFFFEQWKTREVAVHAEVDLGAATRQQIAVDQTQLASYGWVDQANGVVHIPIQQAMELTARQYSQAQ
jgi:hypothetical protein